MNQTEVKGLIPPEVFQMWKVRAEASVAFADEWRDYAMMMTAFQTALEHAPRTAEDCESLDIERLFVEEIERVAAIVTAIFPLGGLMELAFYMPGMKDQGMSARETTCSNGRDG